VKKKALVPVATLVGLGFAPWAHADWLVTRDGAKIETRGPWRVEGKRVLFTLPTGTLSSLRLDQVDLDHSALETERARASIAEAARPSPPPKREPVLRLTDKDLPPVPVDEEGMPIAKESAKTSEAATSSSSVEVANWERAETPTGDGIELFGTVRNKGQTSVTSPKMLVALYGEDGRLLATGDGQINAVALPPEGTAQFRAVFPGVYDFSSVKFDIQGMPFAARESEASEEEAMEPSAEEEVASPPSWP
jgi:hypothetical protein